MKESKELALIIEQEIGNLGYPDSPALLYNPIEYIMGLGGKRIRPLLLLMSYQLFNEDIREAIPAAIGIELFHNFTLLHDDIMDNAPIRRGNKTVHEKWDTNTAILSGDVMMIQAYQLIAKSENSVLQEVMDIFSKAAVTVCEGQQLDMNFETQSDVCLKDYMIMIEYKTAVLLAASLKIGAAIAGANEEEQNHLYEFGINMGIAFQLKDDLLDVFGAVDAFGKRLGGDILANKKTFLYLKSLQIADDITKSKLDFHYSNNDKSESKIKAVKDIFEDLEIQKHTINMMRSFYTKAMKHLDAIDSINKTPLVLFSNQLMERVS